MPQPAQGYHATASIQIGSGLSALHKPEWTIDSLFGDSQLEKSVPGSFIRTGDIASGQFGEVVRAVSPTGTVVAVKRTFSAFGSAPQGAHDAMPEGEALEAAAHPNVVQLLRVISEGGDLFLILELCQTDLEKALSTWQRPLPEDIIKRLFRALLSALAHCHTAGLLHRDIKPANLLLTAEGTLKLADFGHARRHTGKGGYSAAVASRWYRAPELLYGSHQYGPAVDIWAAGCILAELLGTGPLFPGSTDIEQLSKMRSVLGSIDTCQWPEALQLPDFSKLVFAPCNGHPWALVLPQASPPALDLLDCMVRYNPDDRGQASELLRHPWLAQSDAALKE